jgi:putative ABC transport system permease protein
MRYRAPGFSRAFRAIQRHPGSYLAAALTIAAGMGAVVAMVSVYVTVVLHPMGVARADQLVDIQTINPKVNVVPAALSWVRFDNSLRHARSFSHIAAWDFDSASLTTGEAVPEQVTVLRVSSAFFPLLGVEPIEGRLFTPADDQVNGPAVCVMSHELWATRFGGQPIVGRTIDLDGRAVEVIGVLPPRLTQPWSTQQVFLPRLFETSAMTPENIRNGSSFLSVIGRLKPDVTIEQAQAELDGLAAEYSAQFAGRTDAANLTAARPLVETMVGNSRQTLRIVLYAVGAVLLIACANASTLFLGQLLARQRETAVRLALGATRWQVVREFLLESLGLSLTAGAAGLAFAWLLLRVVPLALGSSLPDGTILTIDATAVAVSLTVIAISALLVGLVPALYVTRPVASPLLTFARGETTTPSGKRLRAWLVVCEVALSCALLIGGALLTQSLLRLRQSSPGFDVRGTAAGLLTLPLERYSTPERQAAFAVAVVERLQGAAGVQGAAAVFGLPLGDGFSFHQYVVAGQPIPPPSERQRAGIRLVTEQYLQLMRIRLKAGRLFTGQDRAGAPMVCIVNESLAKRMFGGRAVGEAILRGRDANLRYEIVGVVEDVRSYGIRRPAVDEVFYPLRQLPWPQFAIVARTDGDSAALRRAMEAAVADVDPRQPVAGFATMEQRLADSWDSERGLATMTTAFAAVALVMALVGLYAVLAQSVASRAAEIGVRVALGAGRAKIVLLILRNGMTIALGGIFIGIVAAVPGGRHLSAQLYAVNPVDPWILGGVSSVFALVALLACVAPAWRAATLDPIRALRSA